MDDVRHRYLALLGHVHVGVLWGGPPGWAIIVSLPIIIITF